MDGDVDLVVSRVVRQHLVEVCHVLSEEGATDRERLLLTLEVVDDVDAHHVVLLGERLLRGVLGAKQGLLHLTPVFEDFTIGDGRKLRIILSLDDYLAVDSLLDFLSCQH